MPLEQDVKQKFTNEYQKVLVNILFTSSWLNQKNSGHLKKYNLTPEQFNVIRILRGSHPEPLRLTDIADRMIEKNSNCTRLVEKLRVKELVNRELNPSNRRQVKISITRAGLKLLSEIDNEYSQWLAMLQGISETEARELNRLLDKLRDKPTH